ncbi:MAG: hypothetical protein DRN06_03410 [Thermoprotei archaeon]|nr:MAG: hypothetical protein DRN06_03410 [Thermoprotei archaeon]
MTKALKIILVSADWEKTSSLARKACQEASKEMGIELEERKEDWDFLTQHGVKDEYGGVDIPQVFVELEGGIIKHVLTRIPLTPDGKPDVEAAVKTIVEAVREGS